MVSLSNLKSLKLVLRNSPLVPPQKKALKNTTKDISWETKFVLNCRMEAVGLRSTRASQGRASSAVNRGIGQGKSFNGKPSLNSIDYFVL